MSGWDEIAREAQGAFVGAGRFPLRAYSEFMPPPYVGIKPYEPSRGERCSTFAISASDALDVDEYEQAFDVEPGLDRIADRIVGELGKLVRGEPHALTRTLLDGNPAWPAELAGAAKAGKLATRPMIAICEIALSRTQDDKGNERWTLFGASHEPAGAAFWRGAEVARLDRIDELLAWAGIAATAARGQWAVLADAPAALATHRYTGGALPAVIVTFTPFAQLPPAVRDGYLAGQVELVPHPASLVFAHHPRYRALAAALPRAQQIALLQLFPRIEASCAIRVPQSGWLDEHDPAQHAAHGRGATAHGADHAIVSHVVRTHRWQRVARDADIHDNDIHGDGAYTDKVSTALFSTDPIAVDLYDKPLARNAQLWTDRYELLLDGPRAQPAQLKHAAGVVDAGGRFGYRMYYPPMRAGTRELFWHVPVIASPGRGRLRGELAAGVVTAERDGAANIVLAPSLLARPAHVAAARGFARDPGHARHTTSHNVRKLLEMSELLAQPLPAAFARALLHVGKATKLADWLVDATARCTERSQCDALAAALKSAVGADEPTPAAANVIDGLGTRAFEEAIWASIAGLSLGEFRQKSGADGISVNRGKHGGPAAKAAGVHVHDRRDLDALGDHLHARYRELIAKHAMAGRAECVDHVFRWETDFEFPWMHGWAQNQSAPHERNIVMMIPGANRKQAVVMGDHYDTAYMEDVYYTESGGDLLRASARGADDNHSATTALLLAADQLLALAKAGKLERDVWLVHLTGEEFPGDCLGARALGQALVERSLQFVGEDGAPRDVHDVDVVGAFILDMVGHNTERDRDVFQIAPGEGAGSARLALHAHRANQAWNARAAQWNHDDAARTHAGRAQRMAADSRTPPPMFAHLPLHGEVRVEWEPRSALFNTDGQVFSDLGIPVVLFMENYDISRKGYHDTHDTMENIDLDYCAAVTAIAIETVARVATAKTV